MTIPSLLGRTLNSYKCAIYVCFNYGNHCAITFIQRRHSTFPGSTSGVRTACPYLATLLITHLLLSQSPVSCAHVVWLIYWSYNYSVTVMAEGWSRKGSDSFYFFFILMALSGRIYKCGRYSNFYILGAKSQKENCRQITSRVNAYRSSVVSSHVFVISTVWKEEKGEVDDWNDLNVMF